jgi:hypothetical protein
MWKSLGYVTTTPGTPVKITANLSAGDIDPTHHYLVHSILIQQVRTNVGFVLIGQIGLNESTGLALNAVLPIPTDNSLPNATVGISDSGNPFDAGEYYVDFTDSGDKALVSVLIL